MKNNELNAKINGVKLSRAEMKMVIGGFEEEKKTLPGDRELACFSGCAEEAGAVARGAGPGTYEIAYAACLAACIGSGSPTMPDPWKNS